MFAETEPDYPPDALKRHLETWGKPIDLAEAASLNRGRVSEILSGKRAITPRIALALEKALGVDAKRWLYLQADWDLYEERKKCVS